eukprot:6462235-Amphidinium_carterae.4
MIELRHVLEELALCIAPDDGMQANGLVQVVKELKEALPQASDGKREKVRVPPAVPKEEPASAEQAEVAEQKRDDQANAAEQSGAASAAAVAKGEAAEAAPQAA